MSELQQNSAPPRNTPRKVLLSCVTFAVVAGVTLSVLAITAAVLMIQGTLP